MSGRLWRFRVADQAVRGAFVQLGEDWPRLLAERDYEPDAARLLGQGLAAAPLLLSQLKQPARLTLQVSNAGPLRLFVVQGDADLGLRGLVKLDGPLSGDLSGSLAVTLEPEEGGRQYQGIVTLAGGGPEAWLASYFEQSEQIATAFCLLADSEQASGLMLQQMPDSDADPSVWRAAVEALDIDRFPDQPGEWLAALLGLDLELDSAVREIALRCDCSHERVSRVLLSLGADELDEMIARGESLEAECGFCGQTYGYSANEVRDLVVASRADPAGESRH